MATLWMEHFQEYGSTAQLLDGVFAQVDSDWVISTANPPRAGAKHLRCTPTAPFPSMLRRIFGAAKTGGAGVGYRLYVPNLPANESWPYCLVLGGFLDVAAGVQVLFILGTDGAVVAYLAANFASPNSAPFPVLISRSAPAITAKAYNQVEFKQVPANSGGALEFRVNGVTVYNYTGDTQATANAEVSQVFVGLGLGFGGGLVHVPYMDLADLHAWDTLSGEGATDFVGNIGVLRRQLSADTATADFSLSTGAVGYSLLTDQSDGTYVAAATATKKSAFQAAALPGGTQGIVAQQIKWRGLKTDAADCSVAGSFISSASETTVTGQPMTTAEAWRWDISGADPATSSPWTVSGANASTPAITRTL